MLLLWLLLEKVEEVLFWEEDVTTADGGGGRANGFGGPCAPALRRAVAEGDGGGRTTPVCPPSGLQRAGVAAVFPVDSRGEDSAVALPASEFSLGIWTFRRGRFAPTWRLFEREIGATSGIEESEWARCGWAGRVVDRTGTAEAWGGAGWLFVSTFSGSGFNGESVLGESVLGESECGPNPKCCASTEPRSSIGVKMLRDLDGSGFGGGGV